MTSRKAFCDGISGMVMSIAYGQVRKKHVTLTYKEVAAFVIARLEDVTSISDDEINRLHRPETNLPWEIGKLVGIAIDQLRGPRSTHQERFEAKSVSTTSTLAEQAADLPRHPFPVLTIREDYDMACKFITSLPETERTDIAVDQILRNSGQGLFKTMHDCGVYHVREAVLNELLDQMRANPKQRRSWHHRLHTQYRRLASLARDGSIKILTNPQIIAILIVLVTAASAYASKVH